MKRILISCYILTMMITLWGNMKILMILPDNYGANYYCYREACNKLGWEVTTAAVMEIVTPCPGYASPLGCGNITVDHLISEISDPEDYDCIMLMPSTSFSGNPCHELLDDPGTLELLNMADEAGIVIFAGCSAIRVLAAADIVYGVNVQCPESYYAELTAAGANIIGTKIPAVIDGNIITTMRGQYYTWENTTSILRAMNYLAIMEEDK